MIREKLCVNLSEDPPLSADEQLEAAVKAGFDGFFVGWEQGSVGAWKKRAEREGLLFQSVHAPFGRVETVWEDGEEGEAFLRILEACIRECGDAGVPMVVVHAVKGFDRHDPADIGVERFDRLCTLADEKKILIGFENTEGEEYLARIMNELSFHPSCRFCWDSGHELCYNRSRDMLALYGNRLAGTHLNDNEGVTGAEITFYDDAHMLPFDGAADWPGIRRRLQAHGFGGPLTFEVLRKARRGRHTHDRYAGLDYAGFLREAHGRAVRFAQLV